MNFTCEQAALDLALNNVNHALSSRQYVLPILKNVLIEADGQLVTLTATNLEIGISIELDADVAEPGAITLPAKLLHEYIHTLSTGKANVSVEKDSCTAHIQALRSTSNMKGLDAAEFPKVPTCEGAVPVQLDADTLKTMIQQVAFAAADDESRPVLTGLLLSLEGMRLSLASADAFRLAVREVELEEAPEGLEKLLIPAKTMVELAHVLPAGEKIEMLNNQSQIVFRAPGLRLISRLLEGTFPAYQKIIPTHYITRAVLNRLDFAAAIKSAALFARDNSHITKLTITQPESELGNGSVTLEATAEDLGDGTSTLDGSVEGPEISMLFSSKYLADAVAAIATEEIAIELTTTSSPGVLKPVGADAPAQTYIVMPMMKNQR